jgi:transposase-like protein
MPVGSGADRDGWAIPGHLDELFVNIQGRQQYLWWAVDQDGDVFDLLVQPRRDRRAAERFFRKLLKGQGRTPRRLITDKLRSYSAAHSIVMPSVPHSTQQYENNRAEVSHQPKRQRGVMSRLSPFDLHRRLLGGLPRPYDRDVYSCNLVS